MFVNNNSFLRGCNPIGVARLLLVACFIGRFPATGAEGRNTAAIVTLDKSTTVAVWLETSLKRVFPRSEAGSTNLSILAARDGKVSFQVCVQNRGTAYPKVKCSIVGTEDLGIEVRL